MAVLRNIKVRMKDGVLLATDVVLPEKGDTFAAVLFRTPYNRANYVSGFFAERGIALVVQDVRGRYESEGEFYPFMNEFEDGCATIEWLKAQPWSNGRVAMYGDSYLAHTQFALMKQGGVSVTTLNPRFMCGDGFLRGYYSGGIFNLALTWSWLCFECASACSQANLLPQVPDIRKLLRLRPASVIDMVSGSQEPMRAFRDFAEHRFDGPFWDCCNLRRQDPAIDYPVLLTGGWYDFYAGETIKNFRFIKEHSVSEDVAGQHRMLIGPWAHGVGVSRNMGEIDFGPDREKENFHSEKWLTALLQGTPVEEIMPAPIRIFVMGKNQWQDEWTWPPERMKERVLYLRPGSGLSEKMPDAEAEFDFCPFDYDDPVPTHGGNHSIGPYNPGLFEYCKPGPFEQSAIEAREDVLNYTTSPLEADTDIIGNIRAVLFAASDAPDADWFVRLTDVYPDGRSYNITEGCLRASYRVSMEEQHYLESGRIYRFDIDMGATAICLKAGHSLRVDICCSNFPLFELNYAAWEMEGRKKTLQRIYSGKSYPSCIVIPCAAAEPEKGGDE